MQELESHTLLLSITCYYCLYHPNNFKSVSSFSSPLPQPHSILSKLWSHFPVGFSGFCLLPPSNFIPIHWYLLPARGRKNKKRKKERMNPSSDHISSNGFMMTSGPSLNTLAEPVKTYQNRDWLYGASKHCWGQILLEMWRDGGKLPLTEFQSTNYCMKLEESTGMWEKGRREGWKPQGASLSGTDSAELLNLRKIYAFN